MTRSRAILFICALFAAIVGMGLKTSSIVIPATTCTNQFIRSIALATGVGSCATVGTSDIASSVTLTTPNIGAATATSINFGGQTLSTYTATAWTPTLIGSTTAGTGQTYSTQVGSYEQVGRQVTLRWNVAATSLGTAAGNIQIGGQPSAAANVTGDAGVCHVGFYTISGAGAGTAGVGGFITANTSVIQLWIFSNTGSTALTVAQTGATGQFIGMCSYRAS